MKLSFPLTFDGGLSKLAIALSKKVGFQGYFSRVATEK